jgi:alkylation response protein AidB-like acyl-CoA dehydrogenase
MTPLEALLSSDEREVVNLVGDLAAKYGPAPDDARGGDVATIRHALVDAGLWTLGVPVPHGGGGATLRLRQAVYAALAPDWPALAWAAAHAHAAAEIVAADTAFASLLAGIHDGSAAICVADAAGWPVAGVRIVDARAKGRLARLDPAAEPRQVVLLDGDSAWVVDRESFSTSAVLQRTGLAGAMTVSATVDGPARLVAGAPVTEVRTRLALAGAAIAAGIAEAAADRAQLYARSRKQFGDPLTALPTVRQSLFRQLTDARTALTLALHADPLQPAAAAGLLAANCERAIDVTAAAVQSHGGYGYLAEYVVERLLRDALSLRAATDAVRSATSAAARLFGI